MPNLLVLGGCKAFHKSITPRDMGVTTSGSLPELQIGRLPAQLEGGMPIVGQGTIMGHIILNP